MTHLEVVSSSEADLETLTYLIQPCRPDSTAATCVAAAQELFQLRSDSSEVESLAETVQLTAAQAASVRALVLHGSLLSGALTNAMASVSQATLFTQESSMKVRTSHPVSLIRARVHALAVLLQAIRS
jgi:hypothetical protein